MVCIHEFRELNNHNKRVNEIGFYCTKCLIMVKKPKVYMNDKSKNVPLNNLPQQPQVPQQQVPQPQVPQQQGQTQQQQNAALQNLTKTLFG